MKPTPIEESGRGEPHFPQPTMPRLRSLLRIPMLCGAFACLAVASALPATASDSASLFERTRPALASLRTLVRGSDKQYAAGSAFLVDERGRALTNYHVVAKYLLDPDTHSLEFQLTQGGKGTAKVLAIDVINDLAVVQLDGAYHSPRGRMNLALSRAPASLQKGDPLHTVGNPLDLGFTVTGGSFSGLINSPLIGRIHYTGILNPGMSGGPAVDRAGRLVGVNVSKTWEGDQVAFLVPIDQARALYQKSLSAPPLATAQSREEVTRQLKQHQQRITDTALAQPWRSTALGPYRAPEFLTDLTDCGSTTNHNPLAPQAAQVHQVACGIKEQVYVDARVEAGGLSYQNTYLKSNGLNSLLFATHVDRVLRDELQSVPTPQRARQLCEDRFVAAGPGGRLPVRLIWCAQALRGYPDLYDFEVAVATQDQSREALVSRLSLAGFTWDNALRLTHRLLENLQ